MPTNPYQPPGTDDCRAKDDDPLDPPRTRWWAWVALAFIAVAGMTAIRLKILGQ